MSPQAKDNRDIIVEWSMKAIFGLCAFALTALYFSTVTKTSDKVERIEDMVNSIRINVGIQGETQKQAKTERENLTKDIRDLQKELNNISNGLARTKVR